MRLVIAEDSMWMLDLLVRTCQAIPHVRVVGTASTAAEAAAIIAEAKPDSVLVDLNLAQGTGFDAIRMARTAGFKGTVRLLTSGSWVSEQFAAGNALGVVGFYDKAADWELLKSALTEEACA